MNGSPTNVNLNDSSPNAKADAFNVEWQAGNATPDPSSPGAYVRDVSACYRTPPVGGVFVIDDTFVSPYVVSINDSGQALVINRTSAITLQFPSTVPAFDYSSQGVWNVTIFNISASTVTLDPNGLNLDGSSATLALEQFQRISISTDGTGYYSGSRASGFVGGVVANTGTSVTVGNTHRQKLLTTSNASAVAATLDSTVGKAFMCWLVNLGAGTTTLTPSSGTINGAASLALTTGQGCTLFFDGTNWEAVTGGGGGGGTPGGSNHQVQINASGVFGGIATGTAGQVLTSNGAAADPSFQTPAAAPNFADGETPSGLINGSNTSFSLANTPVSGSLKLYLDGIRLRVGVGNDYTLSGSTITTAIAPASGSILLADYRY